MFGRVSTVSSRTDEGGDTLEASHDHTIDMFPTPKVPFLRRLRESISSTSQVLNLASSFGSRTL